MTTALTKEQQNNIESLLANNMKKVASVLPSHLTPERMLRIAYMAIEKNPDIIKCSQVSLFNAVLEASAMGLEIGGARPLAHLLPYKGNITLIIDYKGFIELAHRSGQIKHLSFHAVYEKDEFSYCYGLKPDLTHVPSNEDDRGKLVYAYAVVVLNSGGSDFEVIDRSEAMKAKERSPAKGSNFSPWNTVDEYTMWAKTAVRRLAKRIPLSPEFQKAAYIEERSEAGVAQGLNYLGEHGFQGQLEEPPEPEDTAKNITNQINESGKKSEDRKVMECPDKDGAFVSVPNVCDKCDKRAGCPSF